jgi:hypothetical protein
MTRHKRKAAKEQPMTSDVRLKPVGQVQLTLSEKASEPPADKRIHPRRPLPLVPDKSPNNKKEEGE